MASPRRHHCAPLNPEGYPFILRPVLPYVQASSSTSIVRDFAYKASSLPTQPLFRLQTITGPRENEQGICIGEKDLNPGWLGHPFESSLMNRRDILNAVKGLVEAEEKNRQMWSKKKKVSVKERVRKIEGGRKTPIPKPLLSIPERPLRHRLASLPASEREAYEFLSGYDVEGLILDRQTSSYEFVNLDIFRDLKPPVLRQVFEHKQATQMIEEMRREEGPGDRVKDELFVILFPYVAWKCRPSLKARLCLVAKGTVKEVVTDILDFLPEHGELQEKPKDLRGDLIPVEEFRQQNWPHVISHWCHCFYCSRLARPLGDMLSFRHDETEWCQCLYCVMVREYRSKREKEQEKRQSELREKEERRRQELKAQAQAEGETLKEKKRRERIFPTLYIEARQFLEDVVDPPIAEILISDLPKGEENTVYTPSVYSSDQPASSPMPSLEHDDSE